MELGKIHKYETVRVLGTGTFGIVVDRWGNLVGVVTAKDLVEEIVGELSAW